jgi:hypothetical protein
VINTYNNAPNAIRHLGFLFTRLNTQLFAPQLVHRSHCTQWLGKRTKLDKLQGLGELIFVALTFGGHYHTALGASLLYRQLLGCEILRRRQSATHFNYKPFAAARYVKRAKFATAMVAEIGM